MSEPLLTIVDHLREKTHQHSERQAYTFLHDGETADTTWTYGELDRQARAIGALLQRYRASGERILLLYPPGVEFIAAFLGCLYANAIAVPAYPPRNRRHLPRIQTIVEDAQASILLTVEKTLSKIQNWLDQRSSLASIQLLVTDNLTPGLAERWQPPQMSPENIAFLQYTSGSTATPKGVMVSHGNLLHNLHVMMKYFECAPDTPTVIWLPPYHDMGLIGGLLEPLVAGYSVYLMSPTAFLQRPIRWLQAISDYKAVISGGPNFAYDLCVNKITPEQRETLDLSSWKVAFNGAEPIHHETLENFATTFAECGLCKETLYPCYGLAEATLFVTGGNIVDPPVVGHFHAEDIAQHHVREISEHDEKAQTLVGCGQLLPEQQIEIVNPDTLTRCSPDQIGEIWISGQSVTQGYWNQPTVTRESFQAYLVDTAEGPFLRTGDLGFVKDNELFVTGRLKDLIIIRGRNFYPQDIEWTVEHSDAAIRRNSSAAFSITVAGEERLVIVAEVERRYRHVSKNSTESSLSPDEQRQPEDPELIDLEAGFSPDIAHPPAIKEYVTEIRQSIAAHHDIQVYGIVLIKATTIPRTSSGKIQRHACKIGYANETLNAIGKWTENPIATLSSAPPELTRNDNVEEFSGTQLMSTPFQKPSQHTPSMTHLTSESIQEWLIAKIAHRLGLQPHEIDIREPFARYGLDSVQAVSLSSELEDWLGYNLSPTLMYEYPNIAVLSRYLAVNTQFSGIAAQLRDFRKTDIETIAVVGLSCRFPGANTPEEFWRLLRNGTDAIREVPRARWDIEAYYDPTPGTPGKMNTRWGGFLDHIDMFDPQFFGISPREAESMDPQQRLLMEIAWEALESAGQVPDLLAGSYTGVFVGISGYDYSRLQTPQTASAYTGTGNALSIAANRLSYFLNLRGPSIAIDTACSSSLVAVHQACMSLRHKECDMALAGGVNLILSPEITISLSQSRLMAADGRCKTFDARADGYARGEGGGLIVLKRLSDALRDGDNILALIRGSAVNQDGRSNGLTAPNGFAQQAVIYQALENASVAPAQISYFEAHGTGTALGDPIEVNALKEVLISGRSPEHPCWIGSVKTNIGHLEAAAGIAGLIKVILALQHEEIPPHLHLTELNPDISLDDTPFSIPTRRKTWIVGKDRRLAGVSSFGFGGTNAHVVVEETLARAQIPSETERPVHLLTLSARTSQALQELARRYQAYFSTHPQVSLGDICFTANTGRSHFDHRLAVVAGSHEEFHQNIDAYLSHQSAPGFISGQKRNRGRAKIAFLCTGQGSQYVNMGRQLYDTHPVFRQAIDRCTEILRPYLEMSLLEVLYPSSGKEVSQHIDQTAYTQPLLFAVEYALAALWMSWGIKPEAVIGHSVGEYVAACLAGVFSLEDALKLLVHRALLMQALPQNGTMVVVLAHEDEVARAIAPYPQDVSIAAVNGPRNVVISGTKERIEQLAIEFEQRQIKVIPLTVSHAFHSPLMEPMLDDFARMAANMTYSPPRLFLISNTTGDAIGEDAATPEYWVNHVRQPVQFARGIQALVKQEYQAYIELGPHPTLIGMGQQCVVTPEKQTWLPTLRRKHSDWQQILQSLGTLYVQGVPVNWEAFDREYPRRRVMLPTYPFQRESYWCAAAPQTSSPLRRSVTSQAGHPLLGQQVFSAAFRQKERMFESAISQKSLPFLTHHRVFQNTLLPSAAYIEMALAAGHNIFGSHKLIVEDIRISQPLILQEGKSHTLQCLLTPDATPSLSTATGVRGNYSFEVFSMGNEVDEAPPSWIRHIAGKLFVVEKDPDPQPKNLLTLQERCSEKISSGDLYRRYQERGIHYGPAFQAIKELYRNQDHILGRIELPGDLVVGSGGYVFHPVLMDAAIQVIGAAFTAYAMGQAAYLLVGIKRLRFYRKPDAQIWSYAHIELGDDPEAPTLTVKELQLLTDDGQIVAVLEGLVFQKADSDTLLRGRQVAQDWLYRVEWVPQMHPEEQPPSNFLPVSSKIQQQLTPHVTDVVQQFALQSYATLLDRLETLSVEYLLAVLHEMDWEFQLSTRFSSEDIAEQLRVVSQHRKLLERLLEMLEEEGWLTRVDGEWHVKAIPDLSAPRAHTQALLDQYPEARAELTLLEKCGSALGQVLRGDIDPLHIIFPAGDITAVAQIYQDSPGARAMNTLVQQAVSIALQRVPSGRIVRFLEIGAGTGGTTSGILPLLPSADVEYTFTDVSPLFLTQAQTRFSEYAFMRYQTLDIEQDPASQSVRLHQYDIVIAANVLHATRDIEETLRHIQQLLSRGGLLIIMEGTRRSRWLDLIFGLTEGWWRFCDNDLRKSYPLLPASKWQQVLQERGFEHAVSIAPELGDKGISPQAVIIANAPDFSPKVVTPEPEHWLIFADTQGIGRRLSELLSEKNVICTQVFPGDAYERLTAHTFKVNPGNTADFQQLFADIIGNQFLPLTRVVHLWSLNLPDPTNLESHDIDDAILTGTGSALHTIQALVNASFSQPPLLWLVTQHAQSIGEPFAPLIVTQAPLCGLGRVIALEHPQYWGGLIDLDREQVDQTVEKLLTELRSPQSEDLLAFRGENRYVARLMRSPKPTTQSLQLKADGTYLITGGLGGLGLLVAQWMAQKGARHLVLIGRSPASDAGKQKLRALEDHDIQVTVIQADVSKKEEMIGAFTHIHDTLPPVRGIIHAAGVFEDRLLRDHHWNLFSKILAPKVAGTWNLHLLTQNLPLDFFILFSSASSLFGAPGMGNYVAANAFVDAMAHYRQAQGLPATSINWGQWSGIGMEAQQDRGYKTHLKRLGFKSISPEYGLELLEYALRETSLTQIGVVDIDWSVLNRQPLSAGQQRYFSNLFHADTSETVPPSAPSSDSQILHQLQTALPHERQALLTRYLQLKVSTILGLPSSQQLAVNLGFFEMGLDSLMALEFKNTLEQDLGFTIQTTLIFDYPTIQDVVEYLLANLFPAPDTENMARATGQSEKDRHEGTLSKTSQPPDTVESSLEDELTKIERLLQE